VCVYVAIKISLLAEHVTNKRPKAERKARATLLVPTPYFIRD
jgi:hypothetical protein